MSDLIEQKIINTSMALLIAVPDESPPLVAGLAAINLAQWIGRQVPEAHRKVLIDTLYLAAESLRPPPDGGTQH